MPSKLSVPRVVAPTAKLVPTSFSSGVGDNSTRSVVVTITMEASPEPFTVPRQAKTGVGSSAVFGLTGVGTWFVARPSSNVPGGNHEGGHHHPGCSCLQRTGPACVRHAAGGA